MNLAEIEKKYSIELQQINEWVHLRVVYYFSYRNRVNKIKKHVHTKRETNRLRLLFYGFKNWFQGYDFLFITHSKNRRLLDGGYYSKNFDTIASNLQGKSLFIESIDNELISLDQIYSNNIVSNRVINEMVYRLSKSIFLYRKRTLRKRQDLFFLNRFSEHFDYIHEIYLYEVYLSVYKLLFKIYKPKVVFVECSYCSSFVIKAAHELGMKVVEVQHGVADHSGYKSSLRLDQSYSPDMFLSFGEEERYLKDSLLQSVFPVGSYYLEYLSTNFQQDNKLQSIIEQYEVTFCVTLMDILVPEVIEFISNIARSKKEFLFIVAPKSDQNSQCYQASKIPPNIITYRELDCYTLLMHSDIHVTVASTCALEAPSLGIVNILLDIDLETKLQNRSILSSEDRVLSEEHTIIVGNEYEFTEAVERFDVVRSPSDIKNANSSVFVQNFEKNIENFINNLDI